MEGHGEKFQGKKFSIYKPVKYYFTGLYILKTIKIFNCFFTKIFVSKMVSKVFHQQKYW